MTSQKAKLPFKIENNVLIGEEEILENDCGNVAELIMNAFKAKPDFIGQVDPFTGKQNTFRQMRERSVKCALWLKEQGVEPGDIIGTCTHNHLEAYIPFFASLYIGAITNAWTENPSTKTIEHDLELTTPKVIFINSKYAIPVYKQACLMGISTKIVTFDEFKCSNEKDRNLSGNIVTLESILNGKFDESEITGFSCATSKKNMRDTMMMLFSSGSTGYPKAVELSYVYFINPAIKQMFSLLPDDIILWAGSLSWVTGAGLTLLSVLSTTTAIKFTGLDCEKMCETIQKYKVNWMFVETGMCNRLAKVAALKKYNVSSLRRIVFGGSTIRRDVHENIMKNLPGISMTTYGMTEVGMITCQVGAEGRIGSSGYIGKNNRLMFVDLDTKKPVGPNTHGEVYIKCTCMMNGYYKDPETTKNVFDEDGWLRTGDVGYYDDDGYVYIVDRIKELIKYRGHHVSPIQIEVLLERHPSVANSVVLSVPHPFDGQHPVAFVQKLPRTEVTEEELKELVAANMEDSSKLRGGVVFITEMPRLNNGKLDKISLRKLLKKE